MSAFVIKNLETGKYVAHIERGECRPVSSYTPRLEYARTFPTREAAERDRCPENERVFSVEDLLR